MKETIEVAAILIFSSFIAMAISYTQKPCKMTFKQRAPDQIAQCRLSCVEPMPVCE